MPISTSLSLLEMLRIRNEEAWHHFVRLYSPLITRWISRHSLQPDDCETVASLVFEAVMMGLDRFVAGSFRGWLKSITRKKVIDVLRFNQRHGTEFTEIENIPSDLETPDDYWIETELLYQRAIKIACEHIAEHHWSIVFETLIKRRSAAEVALEHGLEVDTIYQIQRRVLIRLRELRPLIDLVEADSILSES